MGKIKNYGITLDEDVVTEARKQLEVGQSLAPIINELLKKWIQKKKEKSK